MEKEVHCKECEKKVDLRRDKYVLLGTYDSRKTLDETYFHFVCFQKYWNDRVVNMARIKVKLMQDKALNVLSGLTSSGLIDPESAVGQRLGNMLGTELIVKDFPDPVKKYEIENNEDNQDNKKLNDHGKDKKLPKSRRKEH